jgi:hypothetical protein
MSPILDGKSFEVIDVAQAQALARQYSDEAGRRCLSANKETP